MTAAVRTTTRRELQRVATHVLARRRAAATGRFGLRATPGGIGTPAFGPDDAIEVLRLTPTVLVHEVGPDVRSHPLDGASLADLAAFAGVDLTTELSVGHDTPEVGDPDAPLAIDAAATTALADWLDLGWRALDEVLLAAVAPATLQLWPEHFDAGTSVAVGPGPDERVNLGVSLGDDEVSDPYLYVGPWGPERPGDPAFWNSAFGAVRRSADVASVADAVAFFTTGLRHLEA